LKQQELALFRKSQQLREGLQRLSQLKIQNDRELESIRTRIRTAVSKEVPIQSRQSTYPSPSGSGFTMARPLQPAVVNGTQPQDDMQMHRRNSRNTYGSFNPAAARAEGATVRRQSYPPVRGLYPGAGMMEDPKLQKIKLPAGLQEVTDPATGRVYYVNEKTQLRSPVRPTCVLPTTGRAGLGAHDTYDSVVMARDRPGADGREQPHAGEGFLSARGHTAYDTYDPTMQRGQPRETMLRGDAVSSAALAHDGSAAGGRQQPQRGGGGVNVSAAAGRGQGPTWTAHAAYDTYNPSAQRGQPLPTEASVRGDNGSCTPGAKMPSNAASRYDSYGQPTTVPTSGYDSYQQPAAAPTGIHGQWPPMGGAYDTYHHDLPSPQIPVAGRDKVVPTRSRSWPAREMEAQSISMGQRSNTVNLNPSGYDVCNLAPPSAASSTFPRRENIDAVGHGQLSASQMAALNYNSYEFPQQPSSATSGAEKPPVADGKAGKRGVSNGGAEQPSSTVVAEQRLSASSGSQMAPGRLKYSTFDFSAGSPAPPQLNMKVSRSY